MTALDALISENPDFQAWGDGTPANWSVPPDVLRFIAGRVGPGMRTLETGSGQTTVAFAAAGAEHTAITIDRSEADRIRLWCARQGLHARLTFIHESSEVALARGDAIPDELDFVFIDGAHRFPFPCLDWHFTERRLKVGGIVGIDDIDMPSVRLLHDFLEIEEEWELVAAIEQTSFFRRLRETVVVNDCQGQRLNKLVPIGQLLRPRPASEA
jgi:predicted O-methyltransferase YrrM